MLSSTTLENIGRGPKCSSKEDFECGGTMTDSSEHSSHFNKDNSVKKASYCQVRVAYECLTYLVWHGH